MRIEGAPRPKREFRTSRALSFSTLYEYLPSIGVIVAELRGSPGDGDELWLTTRFAGDFVMAEPSPTWDGRVQFTVFGDDDPVPVLSAIAAKFNCDIEPTSDG